MALGTLDRSLPPFFNQGPSVFSKLVFFGALSVFLMVADARFNVTQPIRAALATALYPVQWVALQPVHAVQGVSGYFTDLDQAQLETAQAREKLALQSLRAGQVELLMQENNRLRKLLDLKAQLATPVFAAEVVYDAADSYTRKVIIDKGQVHKVALGSPVLDESGVLGQVTRVYPLVSEVTLVVDPDLAIPVLNVRTGARSVAYGDPTVGGTGMELRFMGSNADVQEGDLLTTSGVDGVYPPGLSVARVSRIERRAESAFSKIYCVPQALTTGARHVIVVQPVTTDLALPPSSIAPVAPARKGYAK
ncbi:MULTISPECIES: rod shape-determining protein MreC [unclassified Polaromonas]|uniref:rod shape-determining protein MreC n=1 Tax=unclassified Polaromonas TaxID=2638319 RepID=UPI0018CB66FD|nr:MULTISPECIES: rod shape-determining protein MreC [unclassified Polaromonas]MBG6073306.1 rod shape-determining protein MreC [Polaromonas sp. CG_9.7]MBG6115354.1 rod shape-determining protein MreC [Polaromonas sp. CG_9.2]MDH6182941.1 rod shape-determining protein MreC [Polaromonas sp. CG_23.6]